MGDSSGRQPPPPCASRYLEPSYWNARFSTEEHYEWCRDYSHFQHLIQEHVTLSDTVLEVGCGSSRLSESMFNSGISRITCSDLSPVAIEHVRKRCAALGYEGIIPVVADMLNLPFQDCSFDVVIEKGTMDVLFVDSGDPWNPKQDVKSKVLAMLAEVHRVLTPAGTFISISFGQPHFRRPFFEAEGFTWSMQWTTFGEDFHYFFYTLKKGTKSTTTVSDSSGSTHLQQFSENMEHEYMDDENYLFRSTLANEEEEDS